MNPPETELLPPNPEFTPSGKPQPGVTPKSWFRQELPYLIVVAGLFLWLGWLVYEQLFLIPEGLKQPQSYAVADDARNPKAGRTDPYDLSFDRIQKLEVTHPAGAAALHALLLVILSALLTGCGILAAWAVCVLLGKNVFGQTVWVACNFGLWDVIKTIALYLFIAQVTFNVFEMLSPFAMPNASFRNLSETEQDLLLQLPVSLFIPLFIVYLLTIEKGHTLEEVGLKLQTGPIYFGILGYLAILPVVAITAILNSWVVVALGKEIEKHAIAMELEMTDSTLSIFGIILFACVIAPVWEEFFFRGMLYPVLRKHLGVAGGIGLSSLAFSVMHANASQLLPLFALGILLSYLFEMTQCLWSSIVAHAIFNSGSLIAMLVLRYALGGP